MALFRNISEVGVASVGNSSLGNLRISGGFALSGIIFMIKGLRLGGLEAPCATFPRIKQELRIIRMKDIFLNIRTSSLQEAENAGVMP